MRVLLIAAALLLSACVPEERQKTPEQVQEEAYQIAQTKALIAREEAVRAACGARDGMWIEGGKWGTDFCIKRDAVIDLEIPPN